MAAICEICGKAPMFGNTVARAGRSALKRYIKGRSRRQFRPNLQRRRVTINGTTKRIDICTSCLKAGKLNSSD